MKLFNTCLFFFSPGDEYLTIFVVIINYTCTLEMN